MPSAESIRQFLIGVVLPVVTATVAAWIVATVHILNVFGVTEGQVAAELTQLGTWGVTALITALHAHHYLLGRYTPVAKAAAGKR